MSYPKLQLSLFFTVIMACSSYAFSQGEGNVAYQTAGPAGGVAWSMSEKGPANPVLGAPYSATITNTLVQTLADGNRIVQTSTGTTARDSEGRTRRDTALPPIGNLSAANAPHLVFIQDPVAQTSYTLDLTNKTARKLPALPVLADQPSTSVSTTVIKMGAAVSTDQLPGTGFFIQKNMISSEQGQVTTENLGSQTLEGVLVTGERTTHAIPAGEIGNEKPISIVTEVWTSPDLKTVVYSKRSDPRMGEQTFKLTNISRGEPDESLFTVPADFKLIEGPQPIIYRTKQ
jgi:hypothetical protein